MKKVLFILAVVRSAPALAQTPHKKGYIDRVKDFFGVGTEESAPSIAIIESRYKDAYKDKNAEDYIKQVGGDAELQIRVTEEQAYYKKLLDKELAKPKEQQRKHTLQYIEADGFALTKVSRMTLKEAVAHYLYLLKLESAPFFAPPNIVKDEDGNLVDFGYYQQRELFVLSKLFAVPPLQQ